MAAGLFTPTGPWPMVSSLSGGFIPLCFLSCMNRIQQKNRLAVQPRSGHLVGVFKILPEAAILWRSEMSSQYGLDMVLRAGEVLYFVSWALKVDLWGLISMTKWS